MLADEQSVEHTDLKTGLEEVATNQAEIKVQVQELAEAFGPQPNWGIHIFWIGGLMVLVALICSCFYTCIHKQKPRRRLP